jgi:Family of unknown function (DUF5677)
VAELKTDHKQLLKRTVRKIALYLNEQQYHPRSNVMLDRVVLALVSKAVKVAQGVIALIDAGLPEEAFGVSRTLVEIALSLRFITNRHSERRARRFVHYVGKWKILMMRRLESLTTAGAAGRVQPKYTKAELRKMMPDYKLMLRWAREYPKSPAAHWSQARYGRNGKKGKASNARTLALEADGHEKINGARINWQFDYEWVYSWTSQYVHATAACMDSHVTEPGRAFLVQIAPYRNRVDESAVFNTALYLHKILRMAFTAIGQPFPSKLSDPLEKLLMQLAEGE